MIRHFGALVRREPGVSSFLAAGTVVFSVVGVVREQPLLWLYLPALGASVAIVVWVDREYGPIPGALLWMLAAWAVAHLAGGLAPDPTDSSDPDLLYNTWLIDGVLRWDQLVHGFGIGAATAVLVTAARDTSRPLAWGFLWAQLIGVVNESAENVFAVFVENTNVGDALNTTWDLVWHLIGGTVAVVVISLRGIPGERAAA